MSSALARLEALVRAGPDPAGAGARLLRLIDAAGGAASADELLQTAPAAPELAALLFAQSPWLSTLVLREPAALLALARDLTLGREKPEATYRAEAAAAAAPARDEAALKQALRRYRAREALRLGARELGHGHAVEVARELAHLAGACFDAALGALDAELRAAVGPPLDESGRPVGLVVIGLGKLGGAELNFSSDVDVLYVYGTDQGAAGALSLHEYFSRLCERLTRAIGEITDDGQIFRVDLRLRPEGSRGPICNSLPSLERYYETWGRPFERQAWLKARPVAGARALGAEALVALRPFVYPRTTSTAVVADVRELARRIQAELDPGMAPGAPGYDVKLGRGGIREIEFFVQALQLVHGGHRAVLRERATLGALDRLLFSGLVSERERTTLAHAYGLLRRVEHRLQLEDGRQTHRLPLEPEAMALLARRLGHAGPEGLAADLARAAEAVAAIVRTLGADAGDDGVRGAALLDPTRPRTALPDDLAALGFADPTAASWDVERLRGRSASPFGPAADAGLRRLGAVLLEEVARAAVPDQALHHLVDLASRRGPLAGLWRLLADNRHLLRLLANVLGTSDYLAGLLVQDPELLERVAAEDLAAARPSAADLEEALARRLTRAPEDDPEAALRALRRLRAEQLWRIGILDVAGELGWQEVCEQLSDLADLVVRVAARAVSSQAAARYGAPPAPRVAIVALGKHGARELGYGSDLDLLFVYDGDEPTDRGVPSAELWARFAQRFVAALGAEVEEGRLYAVDTRLRPSGHQGTLVTSLGGLRAYHRQGAAAWERLALVKARAVAGDPALGAAVEALAAEQAYRAAGREEAQALAELVVHLRERAEKELARETHGKYNVKSGRGGVLDVELLTQTLQLVHGAAAPKARARATLPALDALAELGALTAEEHAALADDYAFLRRLELRMRLVQDRSSAELRDEPGAAEALARRMGYLPREGRSAGAQLVEEYVRRTGRVRALFTVRLERPVTPRRPPPPARRDD